MAPLCDPMAFTCSRVELRKPEHRMPVDSGSTTCVGQAHPANPGCGDESVTSDHGACKHGMPRRPCSVTQSVVRTPGHPGGPEQGCLPIPETVTGFFRWLLPTLDHEREGSPSAKSKNKAPTAANTKTCVGQTSHHSTHGSPPPAPTHRSQPAPPKPCRRPNPHAVPGDSAPWRPPPPRCGRLRGAGLSWPLPATTHCTWLGVKGLRRSLCLVERSDLNKKCPFDTFGVHPLLTQRS